MTVVAAEAAPTPAKLTMEARIEAEVAANPLVHEWVVAALVKVDTKTARRAAFRGSFRTEAGMRIDALETYCSACRRPQDEVGDEDCEAKVDNTHLIGGDQTTREKRIKHEPRGQVIKPVGIERRHMRYGSFSPNQGK